MKNEGVKDAMYYMSLPYTTILRRDEEGDVVARIKELPGCLAHGKDEAEAIKSLKEMQKLWLDDCIASGQPVPEPEIEELLPSGKWVQRVPRSLHKRLTDAAKRESVSLNQLVTSMLSDAVAARTFMDAFRGVEQIFPQLRINHLGDWGGGEHDRWRIGESKTCHPGLLHKLNAAQKLVPTHAESAYEAKAIAGYKEAAESARRRR